MCIIAGLHILPCLLLLKRQSAFLEMPAMHRKKPASRDVFASEDLTLPCCYATVASSWQKVAQRPRKHAICQELYATGPGLACLLQSASIVSYRSVLSWPKVLYLLNSLLLGISSDEYVKDIYDF